MGRGTKERKDAKFKLEHPDRSGPDPSQQTLLDIAEQQGLLKTQTAEKVNNEEAPDNEPPVGRLGESILWSLSLTMLHVTLDVLVSHQYAIELEWLAIGRRAAQAFPGTVHGLCPFAALLTANCSDSPPVLLVPPTPVTLNSPPDSASSITTYPTSTALLRRQRSGRLLSYIYHK
jgi:hypothetical protein